MSELPTINNFSNVSQSYAGADMALALNRYPGVPTAREFDWSGVFNKLPIQFTDAIQPNKEKENKMSEKVGRRIVKIFIVDPSSDVPLDKAIIYQGEEGLTDSTDQELFFEVDIKALLNGHNVERVKYVDKKATKAAGKDVFLEEARIRDLIMMVTEIAKF